jgi:hypothetical protein
VRLLFRGLPTSSTHVNVNCPNNANHGLLPAMSTPTNPAVAGPFGA